MHPTQAGEGAAATAVSTSSFHNRGCSSRRSALFVDGIDSVPSENLLTRCSRVTYAEESPSPVPLDDARAEPRLVIRGVENFSW